MNVYVLDREFNKVGIIDDYTSLIWRPAYYSVGDFELYLRASSGIVALLQRNYYLVREKDLAVDELGNTTYKSVMIIKNIHLTTDAEAGDFLTYTGRELKFIFHQRIIWKQTNLNSKVEYALRRLVTENAIAPTDSKRIIPALALGENAGLTASIRKQVTGAYLDECIEEICTACGYGWTVEVYNGLMLFRVYQGADRSYNQNNNPYVVFSDSFDNILNSEYELNSEEYANTALIGGEGEGTARIYTTIGAENEGFDRYELFADAKDISQNKDTEDEITLEEYLELLQERGAENLASRVITEGFSGEIISDLTFKYGVDFFLGDTVTVMNSYGISKNVMVLSAIESVDENGTKLIPQFNI